MTASETSETQHQKLRVVRPWRSFIVCAALIFLLLMIRRDLFLQDVPGEETADSLLARIALDPVRLAFAAACLVPVLYTILQVSMMLIEAVEVNKGSVDGPAGGLGLLLRLVTARPLRLRQKQDLTEDALIVSQDGEELAVPLSFGLSAFPMLGFLGTVVGLSGAIEALPGAIGNPDALQPVLSNLHVAFDTTLIGLAGALVCLVGSKVIEATFDHLAHSAER
ncbi:MotA/TolQ/ExbB proton channel family protein [Pelagimonas phthalicica]|uniref:MotA/TolQ/ExbB proton channel family protein n=1 Tax=Pelagimonas phthalicica TaxID=1037362 RepID=A0A238JHQ4_9RHOB|nr:MotA/TolQ/ExbB proton channel family protein [Pelagimonas phthalicica]TDS92421.1 MotA/TolQ/ExbB proton channel family protein [Pelagimonas phthalicica]SMX29482.1 MotA/TolQ/ExbB proton channel family protein [Pelagimonas phthalicica]